MVRFLAQSARWRVVAVTAVIGAVATLVTVPPASSDDLTDRRDEVTRQVRRSQQQLDQSSSALFRATVALSAARERLATAKASLARTRGELAAAEALDRDMELELDAAVRRLKAARAALVRGNADMRRQEDQLRQAAVESYQVGDSALIGLSLVLTSQEPAELSGQLNSMENVLEKEAAGLARLEASQVLLNVKEQEVREAKAAVAERRREAAANLALKESLTVRAEATTARVRGLVFQRSQARSRAAQAKAADREQLRALSAERARVQALLQDRAEQARERARAARGRISRSSSRPPATTPSGLLSNPVDSYITSPYGMRLHPVYKRWNLHDGTDFGAACGTPIRAAADGRVVANYYNSAYGNRVIIDHGFQRGAGLGTAYNHMTSYDTYVGQRVRRGEVIGYAGTTGYSTGCHLHLMVFRDGATVDPMQWL